MLGTTLHKQTDITQIRHVVLYICIVYYPLGYLQTLLCFEIPDMTNIVFYLQRQYHCNGLTLQPTNKLITNKPFLLLKNIVIILSFLLVILSLKIKQNVCHIRNFKTKKSGAQHLLRCVCFVEITCSGRVSSSCSTRGIRRVNLVKKVEHICGHLWNSLWYLQTPFTTFSGLSIFNCLCCILLLYSLTLI
jgi:hypothetical protein